MNALVAAGFLTVVFTGLRVQTFAVSHGWLPVRASRKSAHVLLGTGVLLSWMLYDDAASARWFAAFPLLVIAGYFGALGLGLVRDERTVRGASRSGDRGELLTGPMLYCLSVAVVTLVLWRSAASVAALAFLVFGDGFGEVVGTRVPSPRLPWNRHKTVAGSLAVMVGGWLGCLAFFHLFAAMGLVTPSPMDAWARLLVVSAAGALAESATPGALDNVTVVAACASAAWLLF